MVCRHCPLCSQQACCRRLSAEGSLCPLRGFCSPLSSGSRESELHQDLGSLWTSRGNAHISELHKAQDSRMAPKTRERLTKM